MRVEFGGQKLSRTGALLPPWTECLATALIRLEYLPAKVDQLFDGKVVLAIISPPRANLEVCCSKAITDMINRRQEREPLLLYDVFWTDRYRIGSEATSRVVHLCKHQSHLTPLRLDE